ERERARVAAAADGVGVADRVDDRARLLQRAVGVEQHRHRGAYARLCEGLEQGLEPARLDEGIAVQEAQSLGPRPLRALVGGAAEAEVGFVVDYGGVLRQVADL